MKSILISIKPKWVAEILNKEKTIEIRKTLPKCDLPIDVYIYCTKSNYFGYISKRYIGKVVAKFTLNKVEEISRYDTIKTSSLEQTCLSAEELWNYAKEFTYFWHISNLVIFDRPKELYELHKPLGSYDCNHNCGGGCNMCWCEGWETRFHFECEIQKAPQSWCYVEVE